MAFDVYLQLKGVDGECTDVGHEKWLEISSFSFGMSNPSQVGSATGGLAAGKVSISSFRVTKVTDAASVKLASACAQGQHFDSMQVDICLTANSSTGAARHVLLTYQFTDVMIDSIQWSAASGTSDRPGESISIGFAKATWTYTPIGIDNKSGTKVGPEGWDVTKNAKV